MDGEGWNPLFTRHFNEWEVEEAQRLLSHLGLEAMIFFFWGGGGGGGLVLEDKQACLDRDERGRCTRLYSLDPLSGFIGRWCGHLVCSQRFVSLLGERSALWTQP